MSPLKVRRFGQTRRKLAVGILLCFCAPGFILTSCRQTDRKDSDADARTTAAEAFAANARLSKDPRAAEQLIATLKDSNADVRRLDAEALGEIKDTRAVEPLITTLRDANSNVRNEAAIALGKIKDPRAVEPLIAALKDTDATVRANAAWALGKIRDPRAYELLIAALKEESDYMGKASDVGAIGNINDPRAVDFLISTLKDQIAAARQRDANELNKGMRTVNPQMITLYDPNFQLGIIAAEGLPEDVLIKILNKFGNKEVAERFLNHQNQKLDNAVNAWADKHGFTVTIETVHQ